MEIERIKTGIKGLDNLIEGGFPKGYTVLLTGSAGTGKTILGGQYLHEGAKNNEAGLYVTLEQSQEEIIEQLKQFFPDTGKLIEEKKMKILSISAMDDIPESLDKIKNAIKEIKARRVVIDSLTTIATYVSIPSIFARYHKSTVLSLEDIPKSSEAITRMTIKSIIRDAKEMGCTVLFISEAPEGEATKLTVDGISEFSCDGVIVLKHITSGGGANRTLNVIKLRKTKIDDRIHPMDITDKGIVIHKPEELYK